MASFGRMLEKGVKSIGKGVGGAVGGLFKPQGQMVEEPRYPLPELFQRIPGLESATEADIAGLRGRLMPSLTALMGRASNLGAEERGIRAGMLPRLQAALNIPGVPTEEALFRDESRRLLESIRPGLAARGLATSGPAIDIEGQQLGELANKFGAQAFERGLSRREAERNALNDLATFGARGTAIGGTELEQMKAIQEGIAKLETLPIELRQKLIQLLLGQQGMNPAIAQGGPSQLSQLTALFSGGGQGPSAASNIGGGIQSAAPALAALFA